MKVEDVTIGMRIRMNRDASIMYFHTKEGAIGVVIKTNSFMTTVQFQLDTLCNTATLENPSGEFVVYPQYFDPYPMEETRALSDMLSGKLDSFEKVQALPMSAYIVGSITNLYGVLDDENYPAWRDRLRVSAGYFKLIALPGYCTTASQDKWLHVSMKDGVAGVAFAENVDKHRRDIFTRMKCGKYLVKYHPELNNEFIKEIVATFEYDYGQAPELHISETAEDFVRAIAEGPSDSCMAYAYHDEGSDWFHGHTHPAVCYAAGDIQVAWIDRDGKVTARTLVNKKSKECTRIYGDESKLLKALKAVGITPEVNALNGCRLLKIENKRGCGGYLMPYVDAGIASGGGSLYVETDSTNYWRLNDRENGLDTYRGYNNHGLTDEEEEEPEYGYCGCCGEPMHDSDACIYSEYHEDSYCENCADSRWTYAITGGSRRCPEHDYIRSSETTYVECINKHFLTSFLRSNAYEFDLEYDTYNEGWVSQDDVVVDVNEAYILSDEAVACGEGDDGPRYIHERHINDYKDKLYVNSEGEKFWHESDEIREWRDSGEDPDKYVLMSAGETTPAEEPWVRAYKDMQAAGIVFECYQGSDICTSASGGCAFCYDQKKYRIKADQTPPDNWREIYSKAQSAGVKFVYAGSMLYCSFDEPFTAYTLEVV